MLFYYSVDVHIIIVFLRIHSAEVDQVGEGGQLQQVVRIPNPWLQPKYYIIQHYV